MLFNIYIPGDGLPDETKLIRVGLAQFTRNAFGFETPTGPDGKCGVVFGWPDPRDPRSVRGYLPSQQTWFPAAERDGLPAGRFWVGLENQSPLTPGDCATGQFKGYQVILGDGRPWIVPAAARLPQDIRIGDHGLPIYHVQERYAGLLAESQEWTDYVHSLSADQESVSIDGSVIDYLTRMLQLNYGWLIPDVIEHLGLFTPNALFRALLAATTGMISSETEGAAA